MENTALCGKVMTDDQIETLRRQIAAYSTICEQLAEMHRETTLRQESFTGSSSPPPPSLFKRRPKIGSLPFLFLLVESMFFLIVYNVVILPVKIESWRPNAAVLDLDLYAGSQF
ncbi:hypothetical protein ZIOFF_041694 [Zingiber officinale]|uniref:Uncharacterized protein n=1 Tax=Zingiber officinale TaxID=94328 RepID=A0A8J5G711_ZINOF|nr:hypothetical protein ZIOFF_041694 [Zingiber officinale]